jgi:dTDP-glucose 4,6-dehydratase
MGWRFVTKLIVLGSNSFSGQDFIDLVLSATDYTVIGLSRSPERPPAFLRYAQNSNRARYRFCQLDLRRDVDDAIALMDAEQPDYIVNFAAQSEVAPSWDHPERWFDTNTVALARLVNHLRRRDYLQRFVQISSPEAYGDCVGTVREDAPDNPSTPYAASKSAADMLLAVYRKQFGFPVLSVRATNVYGARQQLFKIIPRTAIYIKQGRMIELHGGGRAVKSYIHIRDVSRGELNILQRGRIGERYHLSPQSGTAVRKIVATIAARMGRTLAQVSRDVAERPGQDAAYIIDSTKARSEFSWQPEYALEDGLGEVIDWVDEHWPLIREMPLSFEYKP